MAGCRRANKLKTKPLRGKYMPPEKQSSRDLQFLHRTSKLEENTQCKSSRSLTKANSKKVVLHKSHRRAEKRAWKTPKLAVEFGTRRSQASSMATIAPGVMQQICPQLHPPKDGTIRRALLTSVLNYNAFLPSEEPSEMLIGSALMQISQRHV